MKQLLNIRVIIIALIICCVIDFLFPGIQAILYMLDIELNKPLSNYFLWGYSPIAFSGFYIGFRNVQNRLMHCATVGFLFVTISSLGFYFSSGQLNVQVNMLPYYLGSMIAICTLSAWTSNLLFKSIKTKNVQ